MAFPTGPTKKTLALAKKAATAAGKKGKSTSEVADALGVESTVAARALKTAVDQGLLRREGVGRSTRYKK